MAKSAPIRTETVPFAAGCRFLGISTKTASKLLKDPTADFPRPFPIGRSKLFFRSLADLQRWLDSKAASAAADRGTVVGGSSPHRL